MDASAANAIWAGYAVQVEEMYAKGTVQLNRAVLYLTGDNCDMDNQLKLIATGKVIDLVCCYNHILCTHVTFPTGADVVLGGYIARTGTVTMTVSGTTLVLGVVWSPHAGCVVAMEGPIQIGALL